MRSFLLIITALPLLAACAQESEPVYASQQARGGDCFNANMVRDFTPRNERRVDIRVSRSRQYQLELAGYCPDVDWSQRIALRTRSGSSFICHGLDAEIIVPDRVSGPQRCLVTNVRRLSPAEIEAQYRRRIR